MQNDFRLTSAERLHFLSILSEIGQAEHILLLGFRDGLTALHLEKVASHLTVTDLDSDQLDNARALFGGTEKFTFLDPSQGLNIPDRSIGLIIVADGLPHHQKSIDLAELKRVLRNNGTLAVVSAETPKPGTSITALKSAFAYAKVWTSQTVTASVMVEVEPAGQNAPFYKGYTSRHEPAGLKIGPGLLQATSERNRFYLFSNEDPLNAIDTASIFCRPPQPQADTTSMGIGASNFTEQVLLSESASMHALAKALSQLTGSEVAPSGPDMMRALSSLVDRQHQDTHLAMKFEDTIKQLEKDNADARSEISRLRRHEMIIRSETDTAIAQRIAQTRRIKKLKALALQSAHEVKNIVSSHAEAIEEAKRTAQSTSRLLGSSIRQLALRQPSLPGIPATNTAPRWIGRISRLRTAALLAKGDKFNRARDWQKAASCYAAALLRDWHLPHIWVQLGHALKEQGLLDEAEAAYREASITDPTDTDALIHLGHLHLRKGRIAAARTTFHEAQRRGSNNPEVDNLLKGLTKSDEAVTLLQLARSLEQEVNALD